MGSSELNLASLRVAFLAGTLGQGGAERQLFYMVRALQQAGCRVRVLSLTQGDVWEDRILALGVPVVWVGQEKGRLARLRTIICELRRERPHIVQSAHFFTNPYGALAARAVGAREIGAIRSDAYSESRVHGRAIGKLGLRLPRALAANSQVAMRNAVALGVPQKRLHFLPNVLETAHFQPAEASPGPFHLVAVGRLGKEKRFDRFIRVVARLRETGEIRATLVGDGKERGELEQLAQELKVQDVLTFVGNVADPRPFFQDAHAAFLCSTYEGTPNVLLEAQSCGLPVVATCVGGVGDIVKHGETGFLIEPGSDEEFLLAQLTSNVQTLRADLSCRLRMGQEARRYIENEYDVNGLALFLAKLYQKVLS